MGWFANSDLESDLYPLFLICEAKEFGAQLGLDGFVAYELMSATHVSYPV
jgi:hypothetical protein